MSPVRVCLIEHASTGRTAAVCFDMPSARTWIEAQGVVLHWDDDGDEIVGPTVANATIYTAEMPEPYAKERSFDIRSVVVRGR